MHTDTHKHEHSTCTSSQHHIAKHHLTRMQQDQYVYVCIHLKYYHPTSHHTKIISPHTHIHIRITSRLRLSTEKQPGKRKYESDGGVMVGEFVCMYVCTYVHVQVCHCGSVLTICVPGVCRSYNVCWNGCTGCSGHLNRTAGCSVV